jgi:TonB family protein
MTFRQRVSALGITASLLLVAHGPVLAQGMYLWSVAELRAKSDLVVVAKVTGTRDTGVKATVNSLPMIEVKTDFKALSVMKGEVSGAFSLRHYRLDMVQLRGGCGDCGTQLDFTTTGAAAVRCREGVSPVPNGNICEYMMFLRRDSDGLFVPTSGQLFPYSSVFELHNPTISRSPIVDDAGGRVATTLLSFDPVVKTMPTLPAAAKRAGVTGPVVLEITVDQLGNVVTVGRVLHGDPLLDAAAEDAVSQWKYRPARVEGHPVSVVLSVVVAFKDH